MLDELAYDLFCTVHGRLHDTTVPGFFERTSFDRYVLRKNAWVEIARLFEERPRPHPDSKWLDDYAFGLFETVHERLGDFGGGGRMRHAYSRDSYENTLPPRRLAWRVIAKVFLERLEAGSSAAAG